MHSCALVNYKIRGGNLKALGDSGRRMHAVVHIELASQLAGIDLLTVAWTAANGPLRVSIRLFIATHLGRGR